MTTESPNFTIAVGMPTKGRVDGIERSVSQIDVSAGESQSGGNDIMAIGNCRCADCLGVFSQLSSFPKAVVAHLNHDR